MNHPTSTAPAALGRPASKRRPAWRAVNIAPAEWAGRTAVGVAAITAGIVLLTGAGLALAAVLDLLLVAAGLDLAVTGAFGHCPLCARLGYMPRSLRATR